MAHSDLIWNDDFDKEMAIESSRQCIVSERRWKARCRAEFNAGNIWGSFEPFPKADHRTCAEWSA